MTRTSVSELSSQESISPHDPVAVAIHLRPAVREEADRHFSPSDLQKNWDVARHPRVARMLRSRRFQFALIVPNQIIFWVVILTGLLGTVVPGLNFGTAITWYIWFCLVFVMMVVVGRAWCAMCPFGGFAEWVQRGSLWKRTQHRLGLGRKLPEPIARYGFLLSVGTFLLLTWIEEFFNIAGPGNPWATSFMVLGIVASALLFFLIFERRTFCRYICPLSALIGTVGAMGSVAGFRTRDRQICLDCETKDCMRGGTNGYGCPWYTWPGSADSNLACGLCSECYKSCPEDNIGLFLQKPLTSVVAPTRRRADIAWAVAALWGLVIFQQFNATNVFASIDTWMNRVTHLAYPNPIDYIMIIGLVTLLMAAIVKGIEHVLARDDLEVNEGVHIAAYPEPSVNALAFSSHTMSQGQGSVLHMLAVDPVGPSMHAELPAAANTNFITRTSRFRMYFLPLMYGLIPVVGADYFARQLPKFFEHATRIVPAVGHLFGAGSTKSMLYHTHILSIGGIVNVQLIVIALGTAASMWASWKISNRELILISRHPIAARSIALALPLACGLVAGVLYIIIHAAP
ncbi:MAG TPA: 4Fe-4S binding protein [Acidimicrobiales bacterium]|nr:4Fe-4S binding protein [Acidimicrobiales bacterium]